MKLLYIAGEGRSGSTLLERILGQHPKIFAAGELRHIWERSFLDNQLCSCKKPFSQCEIWRKIVEDFSRKEKIEPEKIIKAFKETSRIRHYLTGKNLKNPAAKYISRVYLNLYNSILEQTDKKIVIDSSKEPVFPHILAQNANLKFYVIHLARDPRGVAYSWTKKKIRPEITNRKEYMPRYPVIRTALSWYTVNKIVLDLKKYSNILYIYIKYEDLISSPETTIEKICQFLNIETLSKNIVSNNKVILKTNHTVAGNPFRFKTGEIQLRIDDEWRKHLKFYQKLIVEKVTYPLMKKLNYLN